MTVETSADTAQSAVRNYLLFLEDPQKLVDHELIERLTLKARDAQDPIDRLMALSELEKAQRADGSKYRLDFILHAKGWAEANAVAVAAFRQLGVNDDVLRSAGLLTSGARPGGKRRAESSAVRRTVSAAKVKAHVRSLHGKFTLTDLYSSVGGSPMTVRKAVQELIGEGLVKRLGPALDWKGRGRAPIVYESP
jgi:hypothetical protein